MRTGKCAFAVMFLVMIAGVASVSAAEVRPYARLSGVIVTPTTSDYKDFVTRDSEAELDSTVGIVVAGGMQFDQGLEIEAEFGYRSMTLDRLTTSEGGDQSFRDSDISTTTFMGNLRYVFQTHGQFHPYVGGGLGVASHTATVYGREDDDTVVAWQFMLGLAYALTKQVELQGGFRYLGTADLEVERTGAMFAYQTYGFDFGATYRF